MDGLGWGAGLIFIASPAASVAAFSRLCSTSSDAICQAPACIGGGSNTQRAVVSVRPCHSPPHSILHIVVKHAHFLRLRGDSLSDDALILPEDQALRVRFSPLGPRGMRLSRLFLSSSRNDNDAVGDGQVGGINPTLDLFFRQSRNLRRDHTYGVAFRGRVNPILKGIIRFKNSKNCHIPSPRYFRPSVSRLRQGRDGPSRAGKFKLRHYPRMRERRRR
jgi:hypothetical protein